jgi:hypothetical protein
VPTSSAPHWQVRRRPHPRLLLTGIIIGDLLGIGGAWLLHAIMPTPDWWIAGAAGFAIAIGFAVLVMGGANANVDEHGVLRYGFGGRLDLEVPLSATRDWRPIGGGILHGIACTVDVNAVTFHSRKVASPARMSDWRRDLGVDLLLEHLTAEDAAMLNHLIASGIPAAESG